MSQDRASWDLVSGETCFRKYSMIVAVEQIIPQTSGLKKQWTMTLSCGLCQMRIQERPVRVILSQGLSGSCHYGDWRICFQNGALLQLLAASISSFTHESFHSEKCLHYLLTGFSHNKRSKSSSVSCVFVLEVTCLVYHVPLVTRIHASAGKADRCDQWMLGGEDPGWRLGYCLPQEGRVELRSAALPGIKWVILELGLPVKGSSGSQHAEAGELRVPKELGLAGRARRVV